MVKAVSLKTRPQWRSMKCLTRTTRNDLVTFVTCYFHADSSHMSSDHPRLFVILSVCSQHDKTKTAETKITKLGTEIVHHDTSLTNHQSPMNIRSFGSRLGLGLVIVGNRVAGVSYAPLSNARVVFF